MPKVEVSKVVAAPVEAVFSVLSDLTVCPRFMPNVRSVERLEKGEGWDVTAWVAEMQGRVFKWQERDEYDPANRRVTFRQVKGDLKRFEGEWRCEPAEGGTRVTHAVEFDIGIPALAPLLHPVAALFYRRNIEQMLDGLAEYVQSDKA